MIHYSQKVFLTFFTAVALLTSCKDEESRVMNYYPEGRDLVCLNGEGRYTRALYGTNTAFRLETSDRPVFATFNRTENYNIRFFLTVGGKTIELDETSWCKASYQGGRRVYTVRDDSWGSGELEVYALASYFDNGAIWRFTAKDFNEPVSMSVRMCRIAATKFNRNGDLGVDPREGFEPSADERDLQVLEWAADGTSYCLLQDNNKLSTLTAEQGEPIFDKEEAARVALVSQMEINTPDPFFNTLGASLMHAADGIFEGTFLHGAIGWRTQLAGWRGAYAGDVVGWDDRAKNHFIAYSKSMVTDVPPVLPQPQQDTLNRMAASVKKWGAPMYSNGYICRLPGRTDQMSHYDMNLNYFDELLRHFSYNADEELMRYMWPYIQLHHEWEKRNFDADGDHLYDAYCCIWASDALYYNGGAVTHSSAYNYMSNLLTARIAEIIGEDPTPYKQEAEAILAAMNERLWMEDLGYWAEFQDYMGHKRLHKSAAIWSVYTPIDCGVGTPEQAFRATRYVDRNIPHIPVKYSYDSKKVKELGLNLPKPETDLFTISTTDWLPYVWSINNVAHEEVAHMALAYLQAGRNDVGFKLLKADLLDEMYLGACPGNFGQVSYYDKARSESYRDFADNVGITSRAIVNGLFGIIPDALHGKCVIQPAFPEDWNEASIKTNYLSYSFRREGKYDIYEIEQNFQQPLLIVIRSNAGGGAFLETVGTSEGKQVIKIDRDNFPPAIEHKDIASSKADVDDPEYLNAMGLGDISKRVAKNSEYVDISPQFNSSVDDIYRNEYLSPRPPFTTLQIPVQGVGEWCIPHETHEIEDQPFRDAVTDGLFDTGLGLKFATPKEGQNIIYTSLWDNYPESVTVPLKGSARAAYLLMAGSTNHMQCRIENANIKVHYTDGSEEVLVIENPINWRPIHMDYYVDEYAFKTTAVQPYRVIFSTGDVSRKVDMSFGAASENDMKSTTLKPTDRIIPGGAAQILKIKLDPSKELQDLTLTTVANEVVIGLMGITLEK